MMKAQLIRLSKIGGHIVLVLGVIHVVFTPVVLIKLTGFDPAFKGTFLFMYESAGVSLWLAGISMLIVSGRESERLNLSNHIYMISAVFMLLMGIGAPIAMSSNPFGYLSLIIGVFVMAVALLRYKN
jgi:hypothetical protein